MKLCPQCNNSFADDYVFCMNDGTTLFDESGEQQTVVGQRFSMPATSALSPDMLIECSACGLANRANSKFCKKCGGPITTSDIKNEIKLDGKAVFAFSPQLLHPHLTSGASDSGDQNSPATDPTIAFQPRIFTPPGQSSTIEARPTGGLSRNAVIAVLSIVTVAGFLIIFTLQDEGKPTANNTSVNNVNRSDANADNANQRAANWVSNSGSGSSISDSRIGRIGTLTIDTHLRANPGKDQWDLGVQYAGARVRIVDAQQVYSRDGTFVWFKIEVISYGTSLDPKNYGLDKDPGTPDSGWVNSYPEIWSPGGNYRKNLIDFD